MSVQGLMALLYIMKSINKKNKLGLDKLTKGTNSENKSQIVSLRNATNI